MNLWEKLGEEDGYLGGKTQPHTHASNNLSDGIIAATVAGIVALTSTFITTNQISSTTAT